MKSTVLPPPPEISSFLVVGFNSITAILESASQKSKTPKPLIRATPEDEAEQGLKHSNPKSKANVVSTFGNSGDGTSHSSVNAHFSAIFVSRSSQPTILHAHLPQLVATASLACPDSPATRLVQLPKGCDARVCEALGLPRVSLIGLLESAPHSESLLELIRNVVSEIDIPWLRDSKALAYLPVKINAIETFVSVEKDQQQRRPYG